MVQDVSVVSSDKQNDLEVLDTLFAQSNNKIKVTKIEIL